MLVPRKPSSSSGRAGIMRDYSAILCATGVDVPTPPSPAPTGFSMFHQAAAADLDTAVLEGESADNTSLQRRREQTLRTMVPHRAAAARREFENRTALRKVAVQEKRERYAVAEEEYEFRAFELEFMMFAQLRVLEAEHEERLWILDDYGRDLLAVFAFGSESRRLAHDKDRLRIVESAQRMALHKELVVAQLHAAWAVDAARKAEIEDRALVGAEEAAARRDIGVQAAASLDDVVAKEQEQYWSDLGGEGSGGSSADDDDLVAVVAARGDLDASSSAPGSRSPSAPQSPLAPSTRSRSPSGSTRRSKRGSSQRSSRSNSRRSSGLPTPKHVMIGGGDVYFSKKLSAVVDGETGRTEWRDISKIPALMSVAASVLDDTPTADDEPEPVAAATTYRRDSSDKSSASRSGSASTTAPGTPLQPSLADEASQGDVQFPPPPRNRVAAVRGRPPSAAALCVALTARFDRLSQGTHLNDATASKPNFAIRST